MHTDIDVTFDFRRDTPEDKDPDRDSRGTEIARKHREDGQEDVLGDVLRLGVVAKPLQSKAVDPRKILIVEKIEMLDATPEDLVDEFCVIIPRFLLAIRQ